MEIFPPFLDHDLEGYKLVATGKELYGLCGGVPNIVVLSVRTLAGSTTGINLDALRKEIPCDGINFVRIIDRPDCGVFGRRHVFSTSLLVQSCSPSG
jgi:hypothetical protein